MDVFLMFYMIFEYIWYVFFVKYFFGYYGCMLDKNGFWMENLFL